MSSGPELLLLGAPRPFLLIVPPKPGKATRPLEGALNSVCHLVPGFGRAQPPRRLSGVLLFVVLFLGRARKRTNVGEGLGANKMNPLSFAFSNFFSHSSHLTGSSGSLPFMISKWRVDR